MIHSLSLKEAETRFAKTPFEKKMVSYPFSFERAHFIDEENGQVLGRISANLSVKDPTRGYIGFFECDLSKPHAIERAKKLIHTAENWLKQRGVKTAYGPVNYFTLFSYRFELPRDENAKNTPEFSWEPTQPEAYVSFFTDEGYTVADEYFSKAYRLSNEVVEKSSHRFQAAEQAGFKTRPIDLKTDLKHELQALAKINEGSFQESFLSEPFDSKTYVTLGAPQFFEKITDFSFFLLNPQGKEVGYFFLFEDQGYLVWKTLAILPEYQKAGLAGFGMYHSFLKAQQKGLTQVITALIRRGAPSEVLLHRAQDLFLWEHRYAVFQKTLA